jgi:membrane associated rhomboid family serine protease
MTPRIALAACVLLPAVLLQFADAGALTLQLPLAVPAWWQLWTGRAVHWSPGHAVADVAVFALLVFAATRVLNPVRLLTLVAVWCPIVAVATATLAPWMTEYRGLSGINYALLFTLVGLEARRSVLGGPLAAIALGGLLAGKLALDALGIAILPTGLPDGVAIAWQAHAAGALVGVLTVTVLRARRVQRAPSPSADAPPVGLPAGSRASSR